MPLTSISIAHIGLSKETNEIERHVYCSEHTCFPLSFTVRRWRLYIFYIYYYIYCAEKRRIRLSAMFRVYHTKLFSLFNHGPLKTIYNIMLHALVSEKRPMRLSVLFSVEITNVCSLFYLMPLETIHTALVAERRPMRLSVFIYKHSFLLMWSFDSHLTEARHTWPMRLSVFIYEYSFLLIWSFDSHVARWESKDQMSRNDFFQRRVSERRPDEIQCTETNEILRNTSLWKETNEIRLIGRPMRFASLGDQWDSPHWETNEAHTSLWMETHEIQRNVQCLQHTHFLSLLPRSAANYILHTLVCDKSPLRLSAMISVHNTHVSSVFTTLFCEQKTALFW